METPPKGSVHYVSTHTVHYLLQLHTVRPTNFLSEYTPIEVRDLQPLHNVSIFVSKSNAVCEVPHFDLTTSLLTRVNK